MQLSDLTFQMVAFMQERISVINIRQVFEEIDSKRLPIGLKLVEVFSLLFPKKKIFRTIQEPRFSTNQQNNNNNGNSASKKKEVKFARTDNLRKSASLEVKVCDLEKDDLLLFDYADIPETVFLDVKKRVVALENELKTAPKVSLDIYALFLWVRLLCVQQTMDHLNQIEEEVSVLELFQEMSKKAFE